MYLNTKIMNQSDKNSLTTVDAAVDGIIAEMPLDDRVKTAKSYEDELAVVQLALGKYLQYLIGYQSVEGNKILLKDCIKRSGNESSEEAEAHLYILKELRIKLRETHRLSVVK